MAPRECWSEGATTISGAEASALAEVTWRVTSRSPAQTRCLGAALGRLLPGGSAVLLEGELGTGKTLLVQGLAQGLGVKEPVTSPSFKLINEYRTAARPDGPRRLYHIDLFRIGAPKELEELGLEEYFGDAAAVCAVEWAERLAGQAPPEHLRIELRITGFRKRALLLRARGPLPRGWLEDLRCASGLIGPPVAARE